MRPLDPRLLKYAHSARLHIVVIALLGLVTSLLVIVQALLISYSASPIIVGTKGFSDVLPLLVWLLVVVLARGIIVGMRDALSHRAAEKSIRELRAQVLDHAERLGPRWRATHGADTTTLLTRGLSDLGPYFTDFLPQLVLVCTVTPIALVTIVFLDFWSALVALVVVPLIPIFMVLIGRFTVESSSRKLKAMERLSSQLLDLMAGLPTLRGLGRENGPQDHLRKLGAQNTRTTMSTLRVAFLSGGVLEFLATLSVALVAVEVGMRMVGGSIGLAPGLAVIMLTPEVFEPLRQVGAQYHASANGVAAASSAFEILETPIPPAGTIPAPSPRHARIKIEHLSVAARGMWAPADLNATIEPGTLVALRGPSGAGKTTAAMVLLALLPATRGRILLEHADDSTSVADLEAQSWWSHVSWVPQFPTLVPGTIRQILPENVTQERLDQAAAATGFDQTLASLSAGWNTRIGQGGVGLSVGQRQRLALTQALVDDSDIVVLDEPTAHLDAMSEERVVHTLSLIRDQGRTVIVIAHRPAVVAAADQVIDVTARAATPEECDQYPELGSIETLADLEVTLPGFLDEDLTQEANK